ncbi:MAG TPA: glycosyltransferase family 4 protein [Candidatus Sulfotelmatobacter sp.]|nr:glycosyltransferase family 4 protein [Candidatus Sulfotelmatobacter sp.]
MRVAFVTGPIPLGFCGVGDYTRQLAAAMERKGVQVTVLESPGPGASRVLRLRAAVKKFRADITHLQYPTMGFGKGLTPQLFSMFFKSVVTLHEVEGRHILRRLSLYPFWVRALYVIFTCNSNREYALRWAPWLRRMSSVIPLSSNIPVQEHEKTKPTIPEVVHFGLVRPNKGIEQVLEFARLVSADHLQVNVRIVGSSPAYHAAYLKKVQAVSSTLPVTWDLNLSAEDVAQRLGRATLAYFPFPEGASERHTSILAALANGLPVITTSGQFTPNELNRSAIFCTSPKEAMDATKQLVENPALRKSLSAQAFQYAKRFSWDSIAEAHISTYEKVLAGKEK